MKSYFLKNALVFNENKKLSLNIFVDNGIIQKILDPNIEFNIPEQCEVLDLKGKWIYFQ